MDNFFEERVLFQAGIYELRKIGRDIGVKSPTSLKKEDLIFQILQIVKGNSVPLSSGNRRGRPPKEMSDTKTVLDQIIPNINQEKNYVFNNENSFENLNAFISRYQKDSLEDFKPEQEYAILGVFDTLDNAGYIKDKKDYSYTKVIFVSENQIKENNLKKGDLVCAVGRVVHPKKMSILIKVMQVNCQDSWSDRKCFDRLLLDVPSGEYNTNTFYINDQKLHALIPTNKGSRNLIKIKERKMYFNNLYNLALAYAKQKDVSVVCLFLEVLPEHKLILKDIDNVEVFYTLFDALPSQHIEMVNLVIERVKRLAEMKRSVIFIVDDIGKILKNSSYYYKESENTHCYESLLPKQIFALARTFKEGNSITIIANSLNNEDEKIIMLEKELEFISDKVIEC